MLKNTLTICVYKFNLCIFDYAIKHRTKNIHKMTNLEIIAKANEVVRGANFTKIMKVRKNAGACFLICALGNGLGIYGSYTSDTVYANWNNQMVRLA